MSSQNVEKALRCVETSGTDDPVTRHVMELPDSCHASHQQKVSECRERRVNKRLARQATSAALTFRFLVAVTKSDRGLRHR